MDEQIFYFDAINLRSVLRDLLRNIWVIILMVASVYLGLSAYAKMIYVPEYTSTATFMVSAKGSTSAYVSLNITQDMAQVLSEVLQSNVLEDAIEKQAGQKLDSTISTKIITETNLIQVSAVSTSPEKAFQTMKLVTENYSIISDLIFGNAILEVIKDPSVPIAPSNRFNTSKYQKQGMVAAALLTAAAIAVLSVMRDTVQTPKAAKRKLDGRLLRSIRHEETNKTWRAKLKKKNCAPLINNPLVSTPFREDNMSLCSSLEYHMRKRNQKVILITSAGENEGKSTVTANLALSLAAENKKVLVLDCDFRKPAIQKIFEQKVDREQELGYYLTHKDCSSDFPTYLTKLGVYVGFNMSGYKDAQKMISSARLHDFIKQMREEMDYIIIDSPPMLVTTDAQTLAALADVSVMVVREDCIYTQYINDCLDTLRRSTPDMAGYVFNNCYLSVLPHRSNG